MPIVEEAEEVYEYIVVGAGASGCVVANRLSRNHKTLLLEAGGIDSSWEVLMPQNAGKLWGVEQFSWPIKATPQRALYNQTPVCYLGRIMGGSASINTMCWMRGHHSDFDSWGSLGVEGWSFKEVLPYFKRAEGCTFKCDRDIRGTSGPMKLTKPDETHFSKVVLKAAEDLGYNVVEDLNSGQMEGFARIESQTYKGVRWSASQAYLHPVLNRNSLHVVCNALVSKVTIENSFASGVEFIDRTSKQVFCPKATREVIICGGGLLSPKLLLLSGIGNKEELSKLGIDCVRNLPGVGKSLQAPNLTPVATINKSDNYYYGEYNSHKKEMASRDWFVDRSGPHKDLGLHVAALIKTKNHLTRPNINLMMVNGLFAPFEGNNGFQKDTAEAPHYSCVVSTAQCHSKGSVALRSSDPFEDPLVDYGMLQDERDFENIVDAVKVARSIFNHTHLKEDVEKVFMPDPSLPEEDLEQYVRTFTQSHGYYNGTCKMGSFSDPMAVTDNQGRVWGVGKLRVVDSSIIPDSPSGAIVSVCTMLAEKICDEIENRTSTMLKKSSISAQL